MNLIGKNIRLEILKIDHLRVLENDFDPTIFKFYPKPYATASEFVSENLEMAKQDSYLPFAIVLSSTGEAIGCSEFSSIDRNNRKLEIGGSWLKRQFHGTYVNSEAKLLLLTYAFETLNCVRVQFTANVLNSQSRAAIEKIGGQLEGILRNAMILPDGTLRDDAYYSIIVKDWPIVKSKLMRRVFAKSPSADRHLSV